MDTNLVLRAASAGNLTADETLTALSIKPMIDPLYLIAVVPAVSSGDSLIVKAVFRNISDATLQQTWSKSITAAGTYAIPLFCDDPGLDDLSVTLDETDDGAPNFGAVLVYLSASRHS